MTCKECVHYEVCESEVEAHHDNPRDLEVDGIEEFCLFFKPKSRFVEVDDEAIIFVKDKWLMLNMESEHLGEAIKRSVDYLIKNAKERERE